MSIEGLPLLCKSSLPFYVFSCVDDTFRLCLVHLWDSLTLWMPTLWTFPERCFSYPRPAAPDKVSGLRGNSTGINSIEIQEWTPIEGDYCFVRYDVCICGKERKCSAKGLDCSLDGAICKFALSIRITPQELTYYIEIKSNTGYKNYIFWRMINVSAHWKVSNSNLDPAKIELI